MHIGLFTDCYTPQVNGVVTSVKILEEALRAKGHKVTVITVKVPGYKDSSENTLRIPSVPFRKWTEFRVGVPLYNETYRRIKQLNLDVIHTHTEFTVGMIGKHVSTLMGIPIVHTYHTLYEDYTHYVLDSRYGERMIKRIIKTSSRVYIRRYDRVIAPTVKTERALRQYGVKNIIDIVPTGIDINAFNRKVDSLGIENLRRDLGLGKGDFIMLALGRVSKEKSIDVLVRQLPKIKKRVPSAKLLIVGDGPYKSALESLVETLGLRETVLFTGQVPHSSVAMYYSLADVFVSASRSETQGLTIIEAMASGVPVVVANDLNIEGIVLHGQSGYLFDDDESLVEEIGDAYEQADLRLSMIEQAKEVVSMLSKEHFAERMIQVYEKAILQKVETVLG